MLQRFLGLHSVLRKILLEDEWKKKLDAKLTNAEWNMMEKEVKVLGVFYEATLRFSSSSACMSEVFPTITSLLVALTPSPGEDQEVVDFKSKLKRSMVYRLGGKGVIERYSVATLLDPRI